MSFLQQFFGVTPVSAAPPGGTDRLKRALGPWALTAIGLGATIGTGVFVFTGQVAAQHAGPAVTISLLIAAFVSLLAALCYSEFASFLPVSGSAYSYAYATLGEGVAWFIGWNLTLEYMLSASAVAVSWSGYVTSFLNDIGIHLPSQLINAPFAKSPEGHLVATGALLNVPALLIVAVMSVVCYIGIKQSSGVNAFMVALKVGVIVVFIIAGLSFVDTSLWHPYIPPPVDGHYGWAGIMTGAAIIFFSYIGFDTASTTALEARNPQRDVPLGILGALAISAILYVGMSMVLTGMVPFTKLDVDAPVAVALDAHPQLPHVLGGLVKLGAIIGMTSVILMSLLGQPRIMLAMADDGLLPGDLSRCHPKYKTPHVATAASGLIGGLVAATFPLDVLGELISMGILLAFAVVCTGVLILRYTRPNVHRPFRVPFVWPTCITGTVLCLALTLSLPASTWWRLFWWTLIGFAIYAFYGYWHSRVRAALLANENGGAPARSDAN
jgi:APA family basic amino acid/polyamine antiporter